MVTQWSVSDYAQSWNDLKQKYETNEVYINNALLIQGKTGL